MGILMESSETEIQEENQQKRGEKISIKQQCLDVFLAVFAGLIVAIAYHFFQNSNNFAPGGVGGLATITYHLCKLKGIWVSWSLLMLLFNIPIFILVSIFVNRRLGIILIVYMLSQSLGVEILEQLGKYLGFAP